MRSLLLLTACCLLFGFTSADVKTWTKNTNFDDPANWNGNGIVCANDKKIFPKDLVASIFVQKNDSLQELILSDNMALSLDEGVVITFSTHMFSDDNVVVAPSVNKDQASSISQQTTTPAPTCDINGRELQFTAKPAPWFDPKSWSSQIVEGNDSKRFMLDTESVPCSEDRVVFPSKDTFLVNVERTKIDVASMLIHNSEYSTQAAFQNYWGGDESRYEFVNRGTSSPAISGQPCGDDKTCPCLDRYTNRMKTLVCRFKTCSKDQLKCKNPILPAHGQCCMLCGAKLTMTLSTNDSPKLQHELHKQLVAGLRNYNDVKYTMGPQINKSVDVVLIDTAGTGASASRAICDLRDYLRLNETAETLKVYNITIERSDGVDNCIIQPATTLPSISKPTNWDAIVIGGSLAFLVICVLFVCFGVYLYRKRYTGNLKNDMELASVGNRTSQGFDNPVYDTPIPFEDSFNVTYDASGDQVNGFENALYTPGTDLGVSVHSGEKKAPLEDHYAPVVKKSKKKAASGGKKQKEATNAGFDNPVYALRDGTEDERVSMESVPLDEDESQLPAYVEHDGTGFANPIATGLSEEMMAPSLPKKVPISTLQANAGFDNPLFGGESKSGGQATADVGEVTVHVSEPTKKKKKEKKQKSKNGGGTVSKDQGFDNPLYGQEGEQQDFYQPETPGEDDSNPPQGDE